MSSGVLTQEEIDALLRGSEVEPAEPVPEAIIETDFGDMEKDVVGEIANISMGTAATTLSTLLGKKVDITTPKVTITTKAGLQAEYPATFVVVDVHYTDGLQGNNILIIRESDVAIIVDLMMGGDGLSPPTELNEIHLSAISEAMNQMMGSAATSMATMLKKRIDISPPMLNAMDFSTEELHYPEEDPVVKVSFRMVIEGLVDSELLQVYAIPFAKQLVDCLMGEMLAGPVTPPVPEMGPAGSVTSPSPPPEQKTPPAVVAAAQPPYEGQATGGYPLPPPAPGGFGTTPTPVAPAVPVAVQPVQFAPIQGQTPNKDLTNLNLIMDVPLQVTVELGKARKMIRDILELGPGSVVELDKLAGEPVDILVNGKLIAKGEVVVIDENFGVRITDIANPLERITNLQ
ncbi:MAG: flagellar motor switch phosphatase FliY [Heliobacteriaceae bacterium]|nr:flagellar motor switch phosphatase FliY [Heliobacteriaceae bacterium]